MQAVLEFFELPSKWFKAFDRQDPLNPENHVQGYLCSKADHRYGALYITHVNGSPAPQGIYVTPKLKYPFHKNEGGRDGERNWCWPENITECRVYDKMDGTNVCVFGYSDANGKRFASAKLRLAPFIRNSRYGAFLDMWTGLLADPDIAFDMEGWTEDAREGYSSLSFEMFGSDNTVLVEYRENINLRELFSVDSTTADLLDPDSPYLHYVNHSSPTTAEVIDVYETYQRKAEARNNVYVNDLNEHRISVGGTEGYVFYTLSDGIWQMWKCKPPSVETIHWTACGMLPVDVIRPTVRNAAEISEPHLEQVLEMLREEFLENQIQDSMERIVSEITRFIENALWVERVVKARGECTITEASTKTEIMRMMSQHFEGRDMGRVFATLRIRGLVPTTTNGVN